MTTRYDQQIKAASATAGLPDPAILKGVCMRESSLDESASRYGGGEWRMYKRLIQGKPAWTGHRYYDQPEVLCRSYGLVQITYVTATEVGFAREGDWWGLYPPEVNLLLGARHLRRLLDRYGNISTAVSAYNAGRKDIDPATGHFRNQPYVDFVMRAADSVRPTL